MKTVMSVVCRCSGAVMCNCSSTKKKPRADSSSPLKSVALVDLAQFSIAGMVKIGPFKIQGFLQICTS